MKKENNPFGVTDCSCNMPLTGSGQNHASYCALYEKRKILANGEPDVKSVRRRLEVQLGVNELKEELAKLKERIAELEVYNLQTKIRNDYLEARQLEMTKDAVGRLNEELIEALIDVTNQGCYSANGTNQDNPEIDSMALSAYAHALRLLAQLGKFEITSEYGRRVIGSWK
jgi:hypothetical protein